MCLGALEVQVATFSLLALEAVPLEGCTIKLEVDKEMPQGQNEAAVSLLVSDIFPVEVMSGHILKSWGKGDFRENQSTSSV